VNPLAPGLALGLTFLALARAPVPAAPPSERNDFLAHVDLFATAEANGWPREARDSLAALVARVAAAVEEAGSRYQPPGATGATPRRLEVRIDFDSGSRSAAAFSCAERPFVEVTAELLASIHRQSFEHARDSLEASPDLTLEQTLSTLRSESRDAGLLADLLAVASREYLKGISFVLGHEASHLWFDGCEPGDAFDSELRADAYGALLAQAVFLDRCGLGKLLRPELAALAGDGDYTPLLHESPEHREASDLPGSQVLSEPTPRQDEEVKLTQTVVESPAWAKLLGRDGAAIGLSVYLGSGFSEPDRAYLPADIRIARLGYRMNILTSLIHRELAAQPGASSAYELDPASGCPVTAGQGGRKKGRR
jgi:hypothetical protein